MATVTMTVIIITRQNLRNTSIKSIRNISITTIIMMMIERGFYNKRDRIGFDTVPFI